MLLPHRFGLGFQPVEESLVNGLKLRINRGKLAGILFAELLIPRNFSFKRNLQSGVILI
ncbi:hypothetical protein D3C75_1289800 [compost metagenome]